MSLVKWTATMIETVRGHNARFGKAGFMGGEGIALGHSGARPL
jgi:hypothetical protein